jgi:hypothetical protein
MATTIITGRNLTLEIDGDTYTDMAQSATLTMSNTVETIATLSGNTSIVTDTTGTLSVQFLQDWDQASGLAEALWIAADSGTAIAFELVVTGGSTTTFTGNVIPQFPAAGGDAAAILSTTVEFVIDGAVTRA